MAFPERSETTLASDISVSIPRLRLLCRACISLFKLLLFVQFWLRCDMADRD